MKYVTVRVALSDRQIDFLIGLMYHSPSKAAQNANYSASNGHHLLRNPAMRAAILAAHRNLTHAVKAIEAHPLLSDQGGE